MFWGWFKGLSYYLIDVTLKVYFWHFEVCLLEPYYYTLEYNLCQLQSQPETWLSHFPSTKTIGKINNFSFS